MCVCVALTPAFCLKTLLGSHFVYLLGNRYAEMSSLFTAWLFACCARCGFGVVRSRAVHTNVRTMTTNVTFH